MKRTKEAPVIKWLTVVVLLILCVHVNGQPNAASKVYNPGANAEADIAKALTTAKAQRKQVLILAGGNWCSWCMEFNRISHADAEIDSILNADFVVCHLNYSPENKNLRTLTKYKNPQRFGFPVILVLDEKGNLVHTQNTTYLQQGKSYNSTRVKQFLLNWNRWALSPEAYKNL